MTKRNIIHGLGATLLAFTLIHAPSAAAQRLTTGKPPPPLCPYPGQTTGLNCLLANPVAPLLPATQPKFVNELPQPIFYMPDQSDPAFDYYEIFSAEAGLGLASPLTPFGVGSLSPATPSTADTWGTLTTPVNKVWLGLVDPLTLAPLKTEVWGYGQRNNALFPLNNVATYPAMSFRANKHKPVKVMWVNKLPNQHMLCKFPQNASYPCGIDRTLMGVKGVAPFSVGPFGGTQQPDNAMVVHLHGGEIPPDSDGFAELWFGNATTAAAYRAPVAAAGDLQNIDPPLLGIPATSGLLSAAAPPPTGATWAGNSTPSGDVLSRLPAPNGTPSPFAPVLGSLIRPTGDSMIYNYPMVQDTATIWYHDHALAKTRVNVVAGPAGYFYVQEPAIEAALWGATPDGLGIDGLPTATPYAFGTCNNTGILAGQCRDVPIVLQDRAFNADGSINFPNLLGQIAKPAVNPLLPGPNPAVHPQWVPEYFGDHSVVNGITWPKLTVARQAYRFRFLDGSNARCYMLSLAAARPIAGGPPPAMPVFNIIASDQGYLPAPNPQPLLTMCPGERYEVVVDFSSLPAGTVVNLVNTAGAPFPNGITPQAPNSPDAFLANMMQFVVTGAAAAPAWAPPATWGTTVNASVTARRNALVATPIVATGIGANKTNFVLNEVLDPLTKAPLRVQIDGKAFEDPITEMPKRGSVQYWDIVNTTVDAHPMHLHLVQFAVVGRGIMDMNKYAKAAITVDPVTGGVIVNKAIDPAAFLMGPLRPPDPGEQGFKDTARSLPGELLRIVARWDGGWADRDPVTPALTPNGLIPPACEAPLGTLGEAVAAGPTPAGCRCVQVATQVCATPILGAPLMTGSTTCMCVDQVTNATGLAPADGLCDLNAAGLETPIMTAGPNVCGATIYKPYFQPVTSGPYVWHCHIVDHEDNEMMRPTLVIP